MRHASLIALAISVSAAFIDAAVGDFIVLVAAVVGVVLAIVALARRGVHVSPGLGLLLNAAVACFWLQAFGAGFVHALAEVEAPEWPTPMPPPPSPGAVLFTHDATFSAGRSLRGASAFLAERKGQVVVVTARHLLGEAGGVEPAIAARDVVKEQVQWQLQRRQPPALSARVGALVGPLNDTLEVDGADVVVFAAEDVSAGSAVLQVRDTPTARGEVLYLIGCPYAERECVQNSYPLLVSYVDGHERGAVLQRHVVLRGFSGAPIVDKDGVAVGVLVAGGIPDEDGEDSIAGFVDITGYWRR